MSKNRGNIFTQVATKKVGSNRFDLSHDVKMSFNMGELVPTACIECVPGDKFNIQIQNMLRFAPLVSPVMHKVNVTTHYFFVPNRLLWPQWEDFITQKEDILPPVVDQTAGTFVPGSLADYLGYPEGKSLDTRAHQLNAMPIAAYLKIYDEYYRDQNLQNERFVDLVSGINPSTGTWGSITPARRAWMHDYFTSCLPFAQKGDEVTLPLTNEDSLPITYKQFSGSNQILRDTTTELPDPNAGLKTDGTGQLIDSLTPNLANLDLNGTHEVSDINAEAVSINTLRRAFRLQEWLETQARAGTRYIEQILGHFGIRSSDARLQRPEYIGGARQNMVISEVLSTAQTENAALEETPVGQMAGHGISIGGSGNINYRCEEHGWIIGIINVQPVSAYQQGVPRYLSRTAPLDYYWPAFANIGEQEVLQKEIYFEDSSGEDLDQTFGYIPRYSEYKYINSRVAGEMKESLAFWHLGRIFETPPALNDTFIQCQPSKRIFAVTDESAHNIYAHILNNVSAIRKMPKFGVPTI